jgi:3-hydroxybutyryl-CoA dehydratase
MIGYSLPDLHTGLTHSLTTLVTEQMVDCFARLTGDVSPLHADDAFAIVLGHPGRVVHGMFVASFISTLVGVYLPGRQALLHGVDVHFHKPVYIGDALTVSGEVSHVSEAARQIELKAKITNQRGVIVCKATVKVGLHG